MNTINLFTRLFEQTAIFGPFVPEQAQFYNYIVRNILIPIFPQYPHYIKKQSSPTEYCFTANGKTFTIPHKIYVVTNNILIIIPNDEKNILGHRKALQKESKLNKVRIAFDVMTGKQLVVKRCLKESEYSIYCQLYISPIHGIIQPIGCFQRPSSCLSKYKIICIESHYSANLSTKFIPLELIPQLAFSLIKALCHLHENGYNHLDVKPENIFIKDSQEHSIEVCLGDLDLSANRVIGQTLPPPYWISKKPRYVGTHGYIPPEAIYLHEFNYQDAFAFGISLLQIIAGKNNTPFLVNRSNQWSQLGDAVYKDIASKSAYSKKLKKIQIMLNKDISILRSRFIENPSLLEFLSIIERMTKINYLQRLTLEEAYQKMGSLYPNIS